MFTEQEKFSLLTLNYREQQLNTQSQRGELGIIANSGVKRTKISFHTLLISSKIIACLVWQNANIVIQVNGYIKEG